MCCDGAADAFIGPDDGHDQDDGLVQGAAPGVAASVRGPGRAAVVGAGLAELTEGNGVAAVLDVWQTSLDQDGQPYELTRFVMRGDITGLLYDVPVQ